MDGSTRCGCLIRIAYQIGPAACETITINPPLSGGVVGIFIQAERQTAVGRDDARNLPAPEHMSGQSGLGLEERQVVDIICVEDIPPVELCRAILGLDVVGILGRSVIPDGVGQSMGPGVVDVDYRIQSQLLFQTHLQSGVVGTERGYLCVDGIVSAIGANIVQLFSRPVTDGGSHPVGCQSCYISAG